VKSLPLFRTGAVLLSTVVGVDPVAVLVVGAVCASLVVGVVYAWRRWRR
jgi:hypothetical protein